VSNFFICRNAWVTRAICSSVPSLSSWSRAVGTTCQETPHSLNALPAEVAARSEATTIEGFALIFLAKFDPLPENAAERSEDLSRAALNVRLRGGVSGLRLRHEEWLISVRRSAWKEWTGQIGRSATEPVPSQLARMSSASADGDPGSAVLDDHRLTLVPRKLKGLVVEREFADETVVKPLSPRPAESDIVGGPPHAEVVASRGELADEVREPAVVRVAPRLRPEGRDDIVRGAIPVDEELGRLRIEKHEACVIGRTNRVCEDIREQGMASH
jgi:hypothetical protein